MKTPGQKGFSVVEVLLVAIAIGLLGFTGWFVYHARQSADKDYAAAASSTSPTYKKKSSSNTSSAASADSSTTPPAGSDSSGPTPDGPLPAKTVASGPYAGWKTSTLKYEKISFDYPANWTVQNESLSSPKKLNGCIYPGSDEVYLTSPTKEQIYLKTGIDCIGDGGAKAFAALPIKSLGQNLYLAFEDGTSAGEPATSPSFACLAKTANPDTPFDFNSRNIYENPPTPGSTPNNQFCYFPYVFYTSAGGDSSKPETVSSIKNSKDFATAEKIFESMKY